MNTPAQFVGGGVAADFLRRLYVRTLASLFVALLDGRESPAVLGELLEREPRHSDDVSRLDGREGLAVLGDQLEREPRHGDDASRLDGNPLEHEPRLGDGEEVDSLEDDLENANGSTLTDETNKVLVSAMMFFKP